MSSKPNYVLVDKDSLQVKIKSAVEAFLQPPATDTKEENAAKLDPSKLSDAIMALFQDLPTCVDNPPKEDVLCDRDPKANKAPGTIFARSIVSKHVESYDKLHHGNLKKLKGDMMRRIVEEIKNPVPDESPKKFWKKVWIPMTYEEERRRVGHWLRDDPGSIRDTKKVRKRLKLSEEDTIPVVAASPATATAAKATTDGMTLVVEAAVELERRSLENTDEKGASEKTTNSSGQGNGGKVDQPKSPKKAKVASPNKSNNTSPAKPENSLKLEPEESKTKTPSKNNTVESSKKRVASSVNGPGSNEGKATGKRTRTQPSRTKIQK